MRVHALCDSRVSPPLPKPLQQLSDSPRVGMLQPAGFLKRAPPPTACRPISTMLPHYQAHPIPCSKPSNDPSRLRRKSVRACAA